MPMFDNEDLLNMETGGEMETEFTPVPEGEYIATVTKVVARSGHSDKTDEDWYSLDVSWHIDDDEVREATGMERPTARQSIFLDVGDGGLELGKGKNVLLGRLREAVGQNGAGVWAPAMLEGTTAMVRVTHRMHNDNVYADVKHVAAA